MQYHIAELGWNNGGDSLVETQNLASHEEVSARRDRRDALIMGCVYCSGDARFCVSTLGRMRYRIAGLGWNNDGVSPVETQNLASHEEVSARRGSDNVLMLGCVYCSGDARFCVSTFRNKLHGNGENIFGMRRGGGSGIHVSKNKKRGTEALFWASVDIYRFFFLILYAELPHPKAARQAYDCAARREAG